MGHLLHYNGDLAIFLVMSSLVCWCQAMDATGQLLMPPPKFPDFKQLFKKTIDFIEKKPAVSKISFEDLKEDNTQVENCNCHRLLFQENWDVTLYKPNTSVPDETCIVTTLPPPTTVVTTTTADRVTTKVDTTTTPKQTTANKVITSHARPPTTVIPEATTTPPARPPSPPTVGPPGPTAATGLPPSPPVPGEGDVSSASTTYSPKGSSTVAKSAPAIDTQKGGISEGTAIIIGISAGIIAMIAIAAILAACRRWYASPGVRLKHEKIQRQRSDCQPISMQINDTSNSQPPTPAPSKELKNGFTGGPFISPGTKYYSGSYDNQEKGGTNDGEKQATPNKSYILLDDGPNAGNSEFHYNTLKAMEHPHALYYGGFGESSTDKTLTKKRSKKKDKEKEKKEKSLKRKSQASEKRKSKDINKRSSAVNGGIGHKANGTIGETKLDSNFNSLDTRDSNNGVLKASGDKGKSDTVSSKPGIGYLTYENEISLDNNSATYTKPGRKQSDTQSIPSRDLDSIGRWSSNGTLDKSTGPLITDDLISDDNVNLFTYDNPTLVSSKEDVTKSNGSLPAGGVITPPREFQDSLPKSDGPQVLDAPHIVIEPNGAIVRPSIKDSGPDEDSDDSCRKPVSVRQRASMFEPPTQTPVHKPSRHSHQPGTETVNPPEAPLANGSAQPQYVIARSDIDLKPATEPPKPGGGGTQSFLWNHLSNTASTPGQASSRAPAERTVL